MSIKTNAERMSTESLNSHQAKYMARVEAYQQVARDIDAYLMQAIYDMEDAQAREDEQAAERAYTMRETYAALYNQVIERGHRDYEIMQAITAELDARAAQ